MKELQARANLRDIVLGKFAFLTSELGFVRQNRGVASEFAFRYCHDRTCVDVSFAPPELPFLTLTHEHERSRVRYRFCPTKDPRINKLRRRYYAVVEAGRKHEPALELAEEYVGEQVSALKEALSALRSGKRPTKSWSER